ncbi:MAG: hypothetical protein RLZZ135_1743, partial [Cyanobacteriota bacterium]
VLIEIGFQQSIDKQTNLLSIGRELNSTMHEIDLYSLDSVRVFLAAIEEERFQQEYFLQVPVYAIESGLVVNHLPQPVQIASD